MRIKFSCLLLLLFALDVSINVQAAEKKEAPKFYFSNDKRKWNSLQRDEIHDPTCEAINVLQQPYEALSELPYDYTGNNVQWVKALREGFIEPRTNIWPETKIKVLDMDVIMDNTSTLPMVRFPHKEHTEWLDCENCHNHLFIAKVDANPITMYAVLKGEYCGRCHGAVAFPLRECGRCHSVLRATFKGKVGAQPVISGNPEFIAKPRP